MTERINQGAASCLTGFRDAINAISQRKHPRSAILLSLVVDEQDRFTLWSSNIGVFVSVNQSLDFRLRDVPDMVRLFLVQLESIRYSLTELQRLQFKDISAAVDTIEPFKPWGTRNLVLELPEEDLEDPKEPLQSKASNAKDWLDAVHESIEWLYRLSNMVRKASFVSQNRRAAKHVLSAQFIERLRERMDSEVKDALKNADPIDVDNAAAVNNSSWVILKKRLVETMIIRYSRISYRRDRVRDNKSYRLERVDPPSMEAYTEKHVSEDRLAEVPTIAVTGTPKQPPVTPERNRATTVDKSLLQQQSRYPPSQVLSSTPSRIEDIEEYYPAAPIVEEAHSFTCSFCCCILSAQEGRGRAWRKHIERDLDHYICLFHPCPCPYELYSSRQDWLAHLSSQHRKQWVCTSIGHENMMKFDEPKSFMEHMQHCHSESFEEDELATIVTACEVPADPLFERCPFNCIKDIREESMEDHVEHHLRAIALRSLPDPDNDSVFGHLPSTHASMSTTNETENEKHQVMRGTIYGSEVGSLPAWEPWPLATENSGIFENLESGEDDMIPDTPDDFFLSKDIPTMQNRRQQDDAIDQLNDTKLKNLARQRYTDAETTQCKSAAEAERRMAARQMRVIRLRLLSPSSTSRPPVGSGQRSTHDRALETRIEDCLTDVLSNALLQCERRSGRLGLEEKSFFCRSDLESIWSSEPRPLDVVFGHLSEGQRETLLTELLLFISFLVTIDVRPRFILLCKDVFFQKSTILKFKDSDGPRSRADLLQMGLTPRQANSWKEQYRFRPAKITLTTESWEPQRIDPLTPLPFELTEEVSSGVMIHGGFGDDTGYESQYGTVRLCTIPREYIENEIRASETWEPTAPLLRIVKSISARANVIEEARTMKLLKQSLVTNIHISIHDAIVEQRQEDDTGTVSIVSPYASLGDLAQFLAGGYGITEGQWDQVYDMAKRFPRATNTHQLRMSLLGQSKNLASALEFLHNGFTTKENDWKIKCAHLDLKPSNILIFESSQRDEVVGHWKLCDFGISVFGAEHLQGSPTVELGSAGDFFNKLETTIRTSPRRIPGVYKAPEIEHSDNNSNPEYGARTSDIWSFGAIFAEVLAYAHGGAAGVKRFIHKRKRQTTINGELMYNDFFYTTMPEHMRRPSSTTTLPYILRREVSLWLEQFIFEHQPGPSPSGVCLKCWAECVKSILEANPHNRPGATLLSQWIADLHRHSKDTTIPHIQFVEPGPKDPGPVSMYEDDEDVSTPPQPPVIFGSNTAPRGRLTELQLSSREVIDYDLDGKRLVYLTKKSIDVFLVENRGSYPEVEQLQIDHSWHGIKVAEPYLVVWGSRLSHGHLQGSTLRVYNISNGQLSRARSSIRSKDFDVTRRVAVSRQGYIAVIHNDEILILDANDTDLKELSRIKMDWHYSVGKFVDIAFDSPGSTLYAWGNQDLYGVLYAYEFERGEGGVGVEIFRGKYRQAFSEHKALILPFDKRRECVIAVGPTPTSFFLGNIDLDSESKSRHASSSTASDNLIPQKFSEHPSGYYAWAGCTIQDSMLLVGATRKGLLSRRKVGISEQVIGSDGRLRLSSRSSEYSALETKTPWSTRHNPDLNTDVKVGVVPSNEAGEENFIVVYYKKGLVEVL